MLTPVNVEIQLFLKLIVHEGLGEHGRAVLKRLPL
jgi:hypothetical protein